MANEEFTVGASLISVTATVTACVAGASDPVVATTLKL